jgi:predicted aspartyl protease
MNNIFQPLLNTGPQEVSVPEDNVIPIRRDVVGLMNVEVSMGDSVYTLIFDTGAGMSVIKRSFAEQMGMEILETSIDVNSATGNVIKTSLAVAKELGIGTIRAKNVVFLVMEDSDLDFPQVNFFPLGAIGFPLIEELGEISISRTDTLIVKAVPTPKDLNNLGFDDLTPHVYLFNGRDTLEYAFDTGARSSHYTAKYFEKYPSLFDTNTPPDTITTGSAGGTRSHLVYALDSSALYIGNELAVLRNISCHIDYNFTFGEVYGNLGQDLIRQFDLMVLNFEDMYLEFK